MPPNIGLFSQFSFYTFLSGVVNKFRLIALRIKSYTFILVAEHSSF